MSASGSGARKQSRRTYSNGDGANGSTSQQATESEVSLLGSANQHVPLLLPKREKDYSARPPCPIPRDPRQRTTSTTVNGDVPSVPIEVVVKQEPVEETVLQSDIDIKEERSDESEVATNWKEQWLNTQQQEQAVTPQPSDLEQTSEPSQISSVLERVNIKQEAPEEPEQQPIDDQCSVESGSTVGLPSPERMESFSPPPTPPPATSKARQETTESAPKPKKSHYSAPLDVLEMEMERMEQEEEMRGLQSQTTGYTPANDDDDTLYDESRGSTSDSMDQSEPPEQPPPEVAPPPKKKSVFQVLKNPEVFKDLPTEESSSPTPVSDQLNQSDDADGTPRVNKMPAKITRQNRSSMLVEDYLKAAEAPIPVKRPAASQAKQKAAKRRRSSGHESADANLDIPESVQPGPSRDPRSKTQSVAPKPRDIPPPPDDFTTVVKNRIIRRMLKWNTNWVEQQLKQKNEPDLLQGLNDPKLDELKVMHTLGAYTNPKAYLSVYHALLLYEIWWSIVSQFRRMYIKNKTYEWSGILEATDQQKQGKDAIKYLRFTAMIRDKEDKKDDLKLLLEGDLVTCPFAKPKSPESFNAFGYVVSSRITYGMRSKKIDYRLSSGDKDILIEAVIAFRQGFVHSVQRGLVKLTKVASLKHLMALFDYEAALKESKLSRTVLSPDISAFKLVFSGPQYKAENLDPAQLDAVITIAQTMMMCPPEEPKIALLEGAPGTGKTHFIVYLVEHLLAYKERRPRILYCAPTESAVDEFTRRLLTFRNAIQKRNDNFEVVRLGGKHTTHPSVLHFTVGGTIERKKLTNKVQSNFSSEIKQIEVKIEELKQQKMSIIQDIDESEKAMNDRVTEDLKKKLENIDDELKAANDELEELRIRDRDDSEAQLNAIKMEIISSADVVCTSMDPTSNPELDDYLLNVRKRKDLDRPYLCCVMDDAGQCWEPGSLLPVSFGVNKLVLVGDADPLYNSLHSAVARKHGLGKSLFARFQEFVNKHASDDIRLKIKLEVEYRMDASICHWPAKFYYGNSLQYPNLVYNTPLHPYIVLDVRDSQEQKDGGYLINEPEAKLIAKLVVEAFQKNRYSSELTEKSVAVLTFSEKQKDLINSEIALKYKEIEELEGPLKKQQLEVALAKDLQGKEKQIVFVSCIKSALPPKKDGEQPKLQLDFITDYWNAALTRARETLVVIGKLRTLMHDESETLRDFIADAEKRQVIREVSSRYHASILFDTLEKPDF